MTRKVVSPIALDKSINTTEQTPRNIADVLAQQLAAIKTAIESGNGNLEAAFVCYYGVTTATQIKEAIEDGKVPYFYYNGAVAQLWKVETDKYTFRTTNTRSVEGQTILDVVDYVVNGSVWSTITREVSGGSSSGQSYIASVNSLADFDTTDKSGMQDLISVANVPADGVYQVSVMLHITPKTASATKSDLVLQFTSSDNTGWPSHTFHAVVDDSQTFAQQLSFSTSVSLKAGQNTLRIQCGGLNTEYLVFVDELTLAQLVNGVYHNGDNFNEVQTLTEAADFNNDDGVLVDGATGGPRFMLWRTLANKVLGFIKSLSTTITAFRTGDVIPVDGPSGTAKMSKDDLLRETAQNAADSGLVVRQEDAFGKGLFKSIYRTYKSSEDFTTTATYINYGIYQLHLVKTETIGYAGCSLIFADTDDYSAIATKKVRITLVNRSDNDADVTIYIAKNYGWETTLISKKAEFDKIFTLDVDLSQIGMTGVTNVSIELNKALDLSLDVYCTELDTALNVDSAQNALMLAGEDASNYVTQKDVGKIQTFDFSTLTDVITSSSSLNPCSTSMSGDTFTVDLDKTTVNGYVGATARISSDASTISANKLLFKITNSSASTATFETLLTANKKSWETSAGVRDVTIEGNGSTFIEYDFSQYAGTFGSGNVFLCIRYEGATAQHLTLSCFGYVMNDGSVPDVDKSWNSFKFNGKTYEEVDAEIGSSSLKPDMLLTGSYRAVKSSGNTISVSEANGFYSVVAVMGASGYAGLVIKIAEDASTLLNSTSTTIIINNTDNVNSTKLNLYLVPHDYDWSGGTTIKTVTIQPNSNVEIPVDLSQYASSLGSGFIGLAIEFLNLNSTNTISFELAEKKGELVPVNFALDAARLNGKTYEDIVGGEYIACWGDSLTAMGGWTTRLQELSGRRVFNAGTGGENVVTITARQGADVMIVNDMTIPADAQAITIATATSKIDTELGGLASPLLQGGSSHVNPCKIGDIEGTLAWTGSSYNDLSGTWTFTRSVAGDAVVIDRPTAIRTNYDRNYNDPYLMIIFMGQNGGYTDDAELIERHRLMIEHSTAKHFLVLGFSSGTEASRADYESAMKYEFGRNFLSLREYLAHPIYTGGVITSCYGLADEGLTPTADDLAKIAVGQVPSQLLKDAVHYTSATKTIIGNLIYKHLCELNIL